MSKGQRPAFPSTPATTEWREGITIRDYFAAKAMQGLLAMYGNNQSELAKRAYEIADKMVEQREQ